MGTRFGDPPPPHSPSHRGCVALAPWWLWQGGQLGTPPSQQRNNWVQEGHKDPLKHPERSEEEEEGEGGDGEGETWDPRMGGVGGVEFEPLKR